MKYKFERKTDTENIDAEKSFIWAGNIQIQTKGMQRSITKKSAGSIRLARRS